MTALFTRGSAVTAYTTPVPTRRPAPTAFAVERLMSIAIAVLRLSRFSWFCHSRVNRGTTSRVSPAVTVATTNGEESTPLMAVHDWRSVTGLSGVYRGCAHLTTSLPQLDLVMTSVRRPWLPYHSRSRRAWCHARDIAWRSSPGRGPERRPGDAVPGDQASTPRMGWMSLEAEQHPRSMWHRVRDLEE